MTTQQNTDAWIRFMAPVVPQSTSALFKSIDQIIGKGFKRLHLMLSCPGGSVFHGISAFNYLRGAPIEVVTYNFGSVDSIGVVLFCAGTKRISVPHARFLIHGVTMKLQGNYSFDEKDLEERLSGMKIDYRNISKVIADTTSRSVDSVLKDMESRITLTPEDAKNYGLIHEIKSELFPFGANLIVIQEEGQPAQTTR